MTLIEKRGYRDLYSKYDKGVISNVVGKDIKFEIPESSDYIIDNVKSKEDFLNEGNKIAESILKNYK